AQEVFGALFYVLPVISIGNKVIIFRGMLKNNPFQYRRFCRNRFYVFPVVALFKVGPYAITAAPVQVGVGVLSVAYTGGNRHNALVLVVAQSNQYVYGFGKGIKRGFR